MGGVFGRDVVVPGRLDGKTVIITGGNTGIGKATAEDLVSRGARVVIACRDMSKADRAIEDIHRAVAGLEDAGSIRSVPLNLASLKSVRSCAQNLLETEGRIDILINNAGLYLYQRKDTEDGFELQFGVNHLGHFLLTCLLLPRIRSSAPSRIVTVSSLAHIIGSINFDDLMGTKWYNPLLGYANSKLANILFTKELACRLKEQTAHFLVKARRRECYVTTANSSLAIGRAWDEYPVPDLPDADPEVTTYCVHPGFVLTDLFRHIPIFRMLSWMFMISPKQGANTTIYCAVSDEAEGETGLYYSGCQKTHPVARAKDRQTARRLWEESARLTGLGDWDPFVAPDKISKRQQIIS